MPIYSGQVIVYYTIYYIAIASNNWADTLVNFILFKYWVRQSITRSKGKPKLSR